jgi:hypothetical protein
LLVALLPEQGVVPFIAVSCSLNTVPEECADQSSVHLSLLLDIVSKQLGGPWWGLIPVRRSTTGILSMSAKIARVLLLSGTASSARSLAGRGLTVVGAGRASGTAEGLVRQLSGKSIGTIWVARLTAVASTSRLRNATLGLILGLVGVAHEVTGSIVVAAGLLGSPDLLLTSLVLVDGLRKGGRRGRVRTAIWIGSEGVGVVAVSVATEVQLEAVGRVIRRHDGQWTRTQQRLWFSEVSRISPFISPGPAVRAFSRKRGIAYIHDSTAVQDSHPRRVDRCRGGREAKGT